MNAFHEGVASPKHAPARDAKASFRDAKAGIMSSRTTSFIKRSIHALPPTPTATSQGFHNSPDTAFASPSNPGAMPKGLPSHAKLSHSPSAVTSRSTASGALPAAPGAVDSSRTLGSWSPRPAGPTATASGSTLPVMRNRSGLTDAAASLRRPGSFHRPGSLKQAYRHTSSIGRGTAVPEDAALDDLDSSFTRARLASPPAVRLPQRAATERARATEPLLSLPPPSPSPRFAHAAAQARRQSAGGAQTSAATTPPPPRTVVSRSVVASDASADESLRNTESGVIAFLNRLRGRGRTSAATQGGASRVARSGAESAGDDGAPDVAAMPLPSAQASRTEQIEALQRITGAALSQERRERERAEFEALLARMTAQRTEGAAERSARDKRGRRGLLSSVLGEAIAPGQDTRGKWEQKGAYFQLRGSQRAFLADVAGLAKFFHCAQHTLRSKSSAGDDDARAATEPFGTAGVAQETAEGGVEVVTPSEVAPMLLRSELVALGSQMDPRELRMTHRGVLKATMMSVAGMRGKAALSFRDVIAAAYPLASPAEVSFLTAEGLGPALGEDRPLGVRIEDYQLLTRVLLTLETACGSAAGGIPADLLVRIALVVHGRDPVDASITRDSAAAVEALRQNHKAGAFDIYGVVDWWRTFNRSGGVPLNADVLEALASPASELLPQVLGRAEALRQREARMRAFAAGGSSRRMSMGSSRRSSVRALAPSPPGAALVRP